MAHSFGQSSNSIFKKGAIISEEEMARLDGESSNAPASEKRAGRRARAIAGVEQNETVVRSKMARQDGISSNALFDELSQWNDHLKRAGIDLEGVSDD